MLVKPEKASVRNDFDAYKHYDRLLLWVGFRWVDEANGMNVPERLMNGMIPGVVLVAA